MKELTLEELRKMIDTFTISYYLGHNIELVDVNSGSNAYTSGNSDIHIGVGIINQAIKVLPDDVSEEELRRTVRGVFYHELGHILLTPMKNLGDQERDLHYAQDGNWFTAEFDKVVNEWKERNGK